MTNSLYELDYNLRLLDSVLAEAQDEETCEILEETRKTILDEIEEKAVTILTYMSDCEARAEHLMNESKRLAKKAKNLTVRRDFLKNLITYHLKEKNLSTVEYGTFTVTLSKTPARVVINSGEEQWLPDELCTITRTPNKTAIKEHMDGNAYTVIVDGKPVEVAHLETSETIRIR
jgi:hypothetical protein